MGLDSPAKDKKHVSFCRSVCQELVVSPVMPTDCQAAAPSASLVSHTSFPPCCSNLMSNNFSGGLPDAWSAAGALPRLHKL